MPKYFYDKKYGRYMISLVALLLIYALAVRFFAYGFWLKWDKENAYEWYSMEPKNFLQPIRIARNTVRLYPILALTMFIKVLRNSYDKERQLRMVEGERFKAELSYLRSQIHPHFFFNTLNSLYALTLKKSDQAPGIVMRMSGLMHYILYQTKSDLVMLEEEITQLKNYIAIEELRFGDRLEYSFQSSGPIEGKLISPLLLLPFVENALKHSLSDEPEKAWVTIDLKVTDNQLFFYVENSTSKPLRPDTHQGIGLENVIKRLNLSYPNRFNLHTGLDDRIFRVRLMLMLDEKS
jgi:LytS/YehU family sensor histidine kinase